MTVHEKSILLPLLPASLLVQQEPLFFGWLMYYALLSMYPLLCRDKLILQYLATLALFYLFYCSPDRRNATKGYKLSLPMKTLMALLLLSSFVLHFIYLIMKPPEKYPFLFEAFIMFLCFSQFVMLTLYTNIKPWMLSDYSPRKMSKKNVWYNVPKKRMFDVVIIFSPFILTIYEWSDIL